MGPGLVATVVAGVIAGPLWPGPVRLHDARSFAQARQGVVSFAVADPSGRLDGLAPNRAAPSASVVKAMLLVAYLRRIGDAPIPDGVRRRLGPMVRESSNPSARAVYARVGPDGLRELGDAAGMGGLVVVRGLFETRITAADQARFLLRMDGLLPARHRAYARKLLTGIVAPQRWGVPHVAPAGVLVLFKGGWRRGLVHQIALLERPDGARLAIAVLTTRDPSERYGRATIEGIAARLLRPAGARARPPTRP
jgi:hypothetical protein